MAKTKKEVKIGYNISSNDLQHKQEQIIKFLNKGLMVKITLTLRGTRNLSKEVVKTRLKELIKRYKMSGSIAYTKRSASIHVLKSPKMEKEERLLKKLSDLEKIDPETDEHLAKKIASVKQDLVKLWPE